MKVRPAKKFIDVSAKCSVEGMAYGQCILKNYATISKDSCQAEFSSFKSCVQKQMSGKKW
ncbi:hypothetical protein CANTEDRAFT_114079 [Yamadazyma tenuis ATCC 10573]|uniref:IMS import disulfide relay-system CHCH-CHCH-like Cx9C domain-containing protein n=1 Tax=Candida tenuis (strain ATCC 10573 / BCRC 21748 / CBS 615 / JCM 9827 / NBRC 10315 / NRRL Y-1498 / VKM Y-70) TaxID=590646 RepID=G3B2Z6_CANTC|nr:uncharacterized protein CANTEDRAFT_114079 [Yamadazyma tenuis ATCC 10573]EGV64043.1 hypothetical protein CANTEDRAFT_114079 [Yamadazyma tenuis ATCC 10573]